MKNEFWVVCDRILAEVPSAKINILYCDKCKECKYKDILFQLLLKPYINAPLIHEKFINKQGFCPLKNRLNKYCNANKIFCIYNPFCVYKYKEGTFKNFRVGEESMIGIKYKKDPNINLISKENFKLEDIKNIEGVYDIKYSLHLVYDLVPSSEAGENIKENFYKVLEKFKDNKVILKNGDISTIKEFYEKEPIGSYCYIINDTLNFIKKLEVKKIEEKMEVHTIQISPKKKRGRPPKKVKQ